MKPAGRRVQGRGRWRSLAAVGALLFAVAAVPVAPAIADPGDVGFVGPVYTGASSPTASKPESKLWWNDGSWWGSLWDSVAKAYRIHRLDTSTQTWVNTGVTIDTRSSSKADALWDGTKLYVASHVYSTTPATGHPARLYRYSYNPVTKSYSLDSGFPATISDWRTETLVIAKDGTGTLWATWTRGNSVWVNRTAGGDHLWGTPFVPAVTGAANLKADDISSIVSFGPGRIGLMWSNQTVPAMYFSVHNDGDPDTAWQASEVALGGSKNADDHINLKADATGRVWAATKTSQTSAAQTIVPVLVRGASGGWTTHPVWRVSDGMTRPILVLDEENQEVRVFATAPEGGGIVYTKRSSMSGVSFPVGVGDIFIRDASIDRINDVTSAKINVTSATGLVVLASQGTDKRYWHNYDPLGGSGPPPPAPPVASFTGTPTSGPAPLAVSFTDASSGAPTSWSWDFGDGGTSSAQNPTRIYVTPGTYTVSLTVANTAGSDTMTRTAYVTVTDPPPPGATLVFTSVADTHVKSTSPNSNYGTETTMRVRNGLVDSPPTAVHDSYVKFDVAGVSGTVASVTLRLFVSGGTRDSQSLYAVSTGWTETGLTWNTAPGIPGSPPLATIGSTLNSTGTWVEFALGTGAVPGNGTYAFALRSSGTSSGYWSTREGTNPPELVVTLAP